MLDSVRSGEENLFWTSLNVNVQAENLENLRMEEKRVKSHLDAMQLISKLPEYQMKKAYQTFMPFGKQKLGNRRRMPTSGLAEIFPFTSSSTQIEEQGIILGFHHDNPIIKDLYEKSNPNWLIAGTSGAGKSFTAKLITARYAEQGVQTSIIDPHGEYRELVQKLNGRIVELSKTQGMINPLDFTGYQSYAEKLLSLKELFELMIGGRQGLTEPQKAELSEALRKTYRKKGITETNFQQARESNEFDAPKLEDLQRELQQKQRITDNTHTSKTLQVLTSRLDKYVNGALNFFNTETQIEKGVQITCFDISEMPRQISDIAMYLVLDYLRQDLEKGTSQRKMIIIDEAWQLLSSIKTREEETYLFETVKTARKFNLSLGLLVQDTNDLINTPTGKAVKSNTATKLLMKQDQSTINQAADYFNLNNMEKGILEKAETGQGILITDQEHIPITIQASTKEKQLVETEPGWKENHQQKIQEERTPPQIEIPESRKQTIFTENDIFHQTELTQQQVQQFQEMDNWQKTQTPMFKRGKGKETWVKTGEQLTPEHQKIVKGIRDKTRQLARKHNWNITVIETRDKADIEILNHNNGKLTGIEVETGTSENKKERMKKKQQRNNQIYNEWFIVSLQAQKRKWYENYGETITRTEIVDRIKETQQQQN